jgi:predicted porin
MKFTTKSLALTIAAVLSTSTFAADLTIYGKANLSVQSSDEGDGSFTEIKSNASRLGFKGTHDLGNGLEVVYKAEFELGLDGSQKNGQSIWSRSQYVGLKGNFGEVLVGKNDTMLKMSQGKVDQFNDLNGDIKHLFKGENRLGNTVTYFTPNFNQFKLGITYVASEDVNAKDGFSVAGFYGDKHLKKSSVYAALAIDNDVHGYDVTRLTVSGKVNKLVLGALYQDQKQVSSGDKMTGYVVSAKYGINDVDLKAQFQVADHKAGDNNKGFSVGADYKLAKNTKLYTFYTNLNMDTAADENFLAAGIEYKF